MRAPSDAQPANTNPSAAPITAPLTSRSSDHAIRLPDTRNTTRKAVALQMRAIKSPRASRPFMPKAHTPSSPLVCCPTTEIAAPGPASSRFNRIVFPKPVFAGAVQNAERNSQSASHRAQVASLTGSTFVDIVH